MVHFLRVIGLFCFLALGLVPAGAEPINVFAAASLKTALDEINVAWKASASQEAIGVYAASPALAKQIVEGAPADIFISADLDWMDDLEKRKLIKPDSRRNLLGNTLVLIAPAGSETKIALEPGVDLLALLKGGRLAVGETKAVPAGRYAKAALQSLGIWDGLAGHLAEQVNVRAALQFVARGEAPLGIVYGSDANAETKVVVAGVFPETSHPPIIYPVALIATSKNPAAPDYLAFLGSDAASAIFAKNGFKPIK
ncbi:MAG: molybdate ABC transporter substrate-binding protein [Rhizobiales bacterium]|nr:molybdate ABC transporter substrate-binding protein [Hyphomicrobiales bacterium]